MYLLTNEQRRCLGLEEINSSWDCVQLPRSRYDDYDTLIYICNCIVVKRIEVNDKMYCEHTLNESLSPDKLYLLPKTAKGKPVKLSSATIIKRTPVKMALQFCNDFVCLYNADTDKAYYSSKLDGFNVSTINDFDAWVKYWCKETGKDELEDIKSFLQEKRQNVKYKEGDFFRFRYNRKLWGYGRILLDYGKMRKEKKPFWDIFMGKPLIISIYHIATKNKNMKIDDLKGLKAFPSQLIMDNKLFYGEFEIIGNLPIENSEKNYPVNYGEGLSLSDRTLYLQYGPLCWKLKNAIPLFKESYLFHSTGFGLRLSLPIVLECIKKGSNAPYWKKSPVGYIIGDLRNPKLKDRLKAVFEQFGLEI